MIFRHEQDTSKKDIEIVVTYPEKTKTVDRILAMIKSFSVQIECHTEDGIRLVNTADIFYIESAYKKTVVFCEEGSYTIKNNLYQIHDKLKNAGFVRISKYCIINIAKLKMLKPMANSRLGAVLSNGMCVCVTRKYLPDIRRILQEII